MASSFLKKLSLLALAAGPLSRVFAYPASIDKLTIIEPRQVEETYDYIIVGGGTAGLTVGDRLTADGKSTVLVIEVGVLDNSTLILTGGGGGGMDSSRMYSIQSTPQVNLNNRRFSVGIGKAVGGSSAVNGMVFQRGTQLDHDAWAELGGPGSTWDWKGILPYFKRAIHFNPPDEEFVQQMNCTYDMEYWGQDPDTKIEGTYSQNANGQQKFVYDAYRKHGVNIPKDCGAGENGLQFFLTAMNKAGTSRSYARTGHWDDLNRPNYQLVVRQRVNKILFDDDNTATGVQFVPVQGTGAPTIVRARKEVIIAAGTVHTPQVLQLSGIGPAPLLQKANITVRVDLPGVGGNFHDHLYFFGHNFQFGRTPTFPTISVPPRGRVGGPNLGIYLGLPDLTPNFEAIAKKFEAQKPEEFLPADTHPTIIAGYAQQQKIWARYMRERGATFFNTMIGGGLNSSPQNLHPMSRGRIDIDPENPEAEPIVDYRAWSNPIDKDIHVEMIKFVRRFYTSGDLAQYNIRETSPGPSYQTDEEIGEWIRGVVIPSVYHPVGTAAKMPREWGGVVSEDLLVWGTKKLSVIDASIMPTIVAATTCMTTYAIAEKAADLIKARA